MKECAYPLDGVKWLAGSIALFLMALVFTGKAHADPPPGTLLGRCSIREPSALSMCWRRRSATGLSRWTRCMEREPSCSCISTRQNQ